jgi:hypothetical protein
MCPEPGEDKPSLDTAKGLLNWGTQMTATVVVPTVYSRDNWARRRLSLEELGHAADIPGDKVEGMGVGSLKSAVSGLIPGKLLALIANSLRNTLGEGDEKRSRVTGKRGRGTPEPKLAKKRRMVVEQDPSKDGIFSWERVRPAKRTIDNQERSSVQIEKRVRAETTVEDVDIGKESGSGAESKASKSAEADMTTVTSADADMTTVTAKAVKSDNAKVPKKLWNDRVFALETMEEVGRLGMMRRKTY